MSIELGKAYVQVIPSTQGITGTLTNSLTGATSAAGKNSGVSFAGKFGKTAVKAIGGLGIATSVGSVFSKGWNRMLSIDTAKSKLSALGNDSNTVKQIAENANAAVVGTAYGMDAAMTAAASATAAGIKPGKELTRYLTLMGDAAAVAGIDMTEMGSIFNKVAANGKMSTEEMNQLADRGIPIWQLLAKETGLSMDELRDAVSKGKIDVQDFQNAIESGMGGAAKGIGSSTISGALSNINASISRMGANLLGSSDDADSFAGKLLPLMNNLMGFMGKVEAGASVIGDVLGSILGPIMDGIGTVFKEVGNNTGKLAPLKDLLIQIGSAIGNLIANAMPIVVPAVQTAMNIIGALMDRLKAFKPVIDKIFSVVKVGIDIIKPILTGLMKTVGVVVDFVTGKLSFKGMVAQLKAIWDKVKRTITAPIEAAKEKIRSAIDKIKQFFPFNLGKILKLKIPKISVKGKFPFGIGGKGEKPSFSVSWNAQGGIVDGATLIGAGEKGAEAIVPLDPFWKRFDDLAGALVKGKDTMTTSANGGTVQLIINLDGDVIGQKTIDYINGQTIQFGVSPI